MNALQTRQVRALERIADALEALTATDEAIGGVGMAMSTTAVPEPVSAAETAATRPMHTTIAKRRLRVDEMDEQPPLPPEVDLPDDYIEPMGGDGQ